MKGMIRKRKEWKWFVWGKHPGMEDFVWGGSKTPLFQRFSKWVDNGFAGLQADPVLRSKHCSWRFWTKGTGRDVVCGLVRNSCDIQGRSFPLLYLGTGALEEWPGNCSMLPFAFESIWKNFEYVSSARFDAVRQLDDSLHLIQKPVPKWREYQQRIYNTPNMSGGAKCEETVDGVKCLLKIDCRIPENLPYDLHFCQRVIIMGDQPAPPSVFISEIDGWVAVAVISQALTPPDFVWLWGLGQNGAARTVPTQQGG